MKSISNQKGQSLMELIFALLMLVMVLVATITLIVTSINAGRESRDKMIAASLAREGIEIVRNIRDSNWIDIDSLYWDEGLVGNPAMPFIATGRPSVLYFDADQEVQAQIKLYSDSYTQGASAPGMGTQFYRILYLNSICQNSDTSPDEQIVPKISNDDCAVAFGNLYSKVGIRVISEVHWPSVDSNSKVIIEDRLYDWQVL